MILYRFCSLKELEAVQRGETLVNTTDHYRDGAGGSTSVGFCFTPDPPEEAFRYLKGIVCPEVVVKYNIPRENLRQTCGKYLSEATTDADGRTTLTPCLKTEYCMTELSPARAHYLGFIPVCPDLVDPDDHAILLYCYRSTHPKTPET